MPVQTSLESGERSPVASGLQEHRTEEREAEISTHLRTQLLRRIAHDIASPTGVTMTVLEELAADAKRPELVAMARRGLRRLLRLSEQLALAAELEAGALAPETTLEDLHTVAKDALAQAVALDGRREITTACEAQDDKLLVHVDRKLTCSVLREIVGNALRLASSRVLVEVYSSGDKAVVRVSDDGPGFSDEMLANVGKRFTEKSTARGLGLSLSMAKDIARAHGGDLRVEASSLPPGRRGGTGAAVSIELSRPAG